MFMFFKLRINVNITVCALMFGKGLASEMTTRNGFSFRNATLTCFHISVTRGSDWWQCGQFKVCAYYKLPQIVTMLCITAAFLIVQ